jgi:hypothetical protein
VYALNVASVDAAQVNAHFLSFFSAFILNINLTIVICYYLSRISPCMETFCYEIYVYFCE